MNSKYFSTTKKQLQQRRRLKRKQLLDQLLYQQPDSTKPNTFVPVPTEAQLNFDDNFPWEDAASLAKYDHAFKSGSILGWEKKLKENQELQENQKEYENTERPYVTLFIFSNSVFLL